MAGRLQAQDPRPHMGARTGARSRTAANPIIVHVERFVMLWTVWMGCFSCSSTNKCKRGGKVILAFGEDGEGEKKQELE